MAVLEMLELLKSLLVIGILSLLFYWYQTKNFNYWKERKVLFIKPHWLFGSFKTSIMQTRSWPNYCRDLYDTYKEHRFVGTYTFRQPSLFILDPQLIDKVLVQDFVCFEDRGVPHNTREPLFGSPFYLKGQKWRDLRHQLLPAFSSLKVKDMFTQILQCGEHVVKHIFQHERSDGIEIEDMTLVFSSEVIASCTFGIQLKTDPDIWSQFLRAVKLAVFLTPWQISKYLLSMLYPRIFQWFRIRHNDKTVTRFFSNLTQSTIKYREENKVERNDFLQSVLAIKHKEEAETNGNTTEGMIQIFKDPTSLHSKRSYEIKKKTYLFSDSCIASVMFSFVTVGVSYEVGTISFALFELAKNPLIQSKLQEEVDACLRKHGSLNYDATKEMTYLDQVLQETLRMHTLSPVLTRDVTAPYTLPDTDVTLDPGMFVLIPIAAIHMDPRYYPSPEEFNPDRFVNNHYKPSSVYLPFGLGPRMCLAIKFAVLTMKVCIASIVLKYNVSISDRLKLPLSLDENGLFKKSDGGIWLSFESRI